MTPDAGDPRPPRQHAPAFRAARCKVGLDAEDQLFVASVVADVPVDILVAMHEKHLVGGLTAGSVR